MSHGIAWTPESLGHGLRPMTGRDPNESERAATPLELLFDLVFVVAFAQAGSGFAHAVAEGHWADGLIGFAFAMFAIVWAWIQFTWFASAFDTDDWAYRLATMVIMIGALILALGIPEMFHSLEAGHAIENGVMVAGYIVMRLAMVSLWLRAGHADPDCKPVTSTYIASIVVAQIGWTALVFLDLDVGPFFAAVAVLIAIETSGPYVAETRKGGTRWHPHHVAERYGLLAIIALGEGVIGTVATLSALIELQGWAKETIVIAVAGIGLTFGMWWVYFIVPHGQVLDLRRETSFVWGYGHMFVYAAIAAMGAGLHVAALVLEHHADISEFAAVMTVLVPVTAFLALVYGLHTYLLDGFDALHSYLLIGTVAVLGAVIAMARLDVAMHWCLLVLSVAPVVSVVGFEWQGRHHQAAALTAIAERRP